MLAAAAMTLRRRGGHHPVWSSLDETRSDQDTTDEDTDFGWRSRRAGRRPIREVRVRVPMALPTGTTVQAEIWSSTMNPDSSLHTLAFRAISITDDGGRVQGVNR